MDIESGKYNPETVVKHTHEGSIGNLNLKEIESLMANVVGSFGFEKIALALNGLLSPE